MTRTTTSLDRVVTLLVGLTVIAGAIIAAGWFYGWWSWLPAEVDSAAALELTDRPWWPWALGGVTFLLLVLGLRWLFAHAPARRVGVLRLAGSGSEGRLGVDAGSAVAVACADLEARHDVRTARGVVLRDRQQLVIDLRLTLELFCDLAEVSAAVDRTTAALTNGLERPDLYCRVCLDVGTRPRSSRAGVR